MLRVFLVLFSFTNVALALPKAENSWDQSVVSPQGTPGPHHPPSVQFVECGDKNLPDYGTVQVNNHARLADVKILLCIGSAGAARGLKRPVGDKCTTCANRLPVGSNAEVKIHASEDVNRRQKYLVFAFKGALAGDEKELYPTADNVFPKQWTLTDPVPANETSATHSCPQR